MKMKSGFKMMLSVAVLLIVSIYSKAEVIRLEVKEDKANCTGVAPMTCLQVKYKNSKDWELFYSSITGFKYQPGYRYVLLVERTKRKHVPADASAYTYKLRKVVKKQKIATTDGAWSYVLKHKWKLIQMNGVTQENSPVFMVFDKNRDRVSGSSGCNSFFGGYEKSSGTLTFKHLAGTLMACDESRSKLEGTFLELLSDKTLRYDIADQTLNFYKDDKLVLMFGATPLTTK